MHPDAEIRLPADVAYVAVLRMTASGIAARLDFTIDEIEDLKMAVSEASALVLADAVPGGSLIGRFQLGEGSIAVEVAADVVTPTVPDPDGFAWQVLTTMADEVTASTSGDRLGISLNLTAAPRTSA